MSKRIAWISLIILLSSFLFSYSKKPVKVYVEWVEKPKIDVTDIKRIAILDFQSSPYEYGRRCATILAAELLKQKYYQIIEREQLERIAYEQKLSLSGLVAESTVAEVGKILGVDAIILGEVVAEVDTEKGTEKVKMRVGTGEYEIVEERKYIIVGPKVRRKREKMKEIVTEEEFIVKKGSVSVTFKMVNVNTGGIITAEKVSRSYSKRATGKYEIERLPADNSILNTLLEEALKEIIPKISPHRVKDVRYLEYGRKRQKLIREGVNLALNNNWEEAMKRWEEQIRIEGDKADAAIGNLGVASEIKGDFKKAEEYYKKACNLKLGRKTYNHNYKRLLYRLENELTGELGVELGAAKIKIVIYEENNRIYIDVGKRDNAQVGDVYIVYEEKIIKHPITGEVMGKEEIEKAKIRIIKVFDKMSVCEVIEKKEEINIKDKVKKM